MYISARTDLVALFLTFTRVTGARVRDSQLEKRGQRRIQKLLTEFRIACFPLGTIQVSPKKFIQHCYVCRLLYITDKRRCNASASSYIYAAATQPTAGGNIGITSLACINVWCEALHSEQFQMCNAIPILPPFFLYHPYIPHFLIQRIFIF